MWAREATAVIDALMAHPEGLTLEGLMEEIGKSEDKLVVSWLTRDRGVSLTRLMTEYLVCVREKEGKYFFDDHDGKGPWHYDWQFAPPGSRKDESLGKYVAGKRRADRLKLELDIERRAREARERGI